MKIHRFFFIFSALLLLLTACGESQQKEQSYVLSDSGMHIEFLMLTEVNGSQLTGSQIEAFYDTPLSVTAPSEPYIVENKATGTLDGKRVRLTVGGVLSLDGTKEGNDLKLSTLDRSSGMQVERRWYAVADETYNTLLASFKAHVKTRLKILSLVQLQAFLPANSDSDAVKSQVSGTRQEVDFLLSAWNDVEQSSNQCQTLKERLLPFYPLGDGTFTLPQPDESELGKAVKEVETAWTKARSAKLPSLPKGITLSWQLSQGEIDTNLASARKLLATLSQTITDQKPEMQKIQQEYSSLVAKVEPLKQSCGL